MLMITSGATTSSREVLTPKLDWNNVTCFLDVYPCDVVHILDCCYAAEATKQAEILCASSRGETATADLAKCFTKALIEELRHNSSTPLTIAMLHMEIMRNRQKHGLDSTPFYCKALHKQSVILPSKGWKGKGKALNLASNSSRMLITAHLDEDLARGNVDGLKKWLTTMLPSSVLGLDIKLEGKWDSYSCFPLFSVPICVWSQIDGRNPAFTFVGEVSSGNKLLELNAPALALRGAPTSGMENTKPGQSPWKK